MQQKLKLYCLSGLGVDHRAFSRITIPSAELIHVPWMDPIKGETLEAYAQRLFEATQPEENYALVGVSFGGMIAQEWAKIAVPKHLVLISTAYSYKNVKAALRVPGKLGLNRLLHPKLVSIFPSVINFFFGAKSKEEKAMLQSILNDTDPRFLRWATGALLRWKSFESTNTVVIHGKHDRMISRPRNVQFETNGGHFTVFSDGIEISDFLTRIFIEK